MDDKLLSKEEGTKLLVTDIAGINRSTISFTNEK